MEDRDKSALNVHVTEEERVEGSAWSLGPSTRLYGTCGALPGATEARGGPVNSATPLWTLKRRCVQGVPPSPAVVRGREVTDPPSLLSARADEGKITGWTALRGAQRCHPLITVTSLTYGCLLYMLVHWDTAAQQRIHYTLKTCARTAKMHERRQSWWIRSTVKH